MAPKAQASDNLWIEETVKEAVRRTRVAGLIAALQEAQKEDANTGGAGYAAAPEAKAAAALPETAGKACKTCGVTMEKDKYSKKQWTLGPDRRCISCVEKGSKESASWETVEKGEKKKGDKKEAQPKAKSAVKPSLYEEDDDDKKEEDEDDGFEEVGKKKMSKKQMKENPGFKDLKPSK